MMKCITINILTKICSSLVIYSLFYPSILLGGGQSFFSFQPADITFDEIYVMAISRYLSERQEFNFGLIKNINTDTLELEGVDKKIELAVLSKTVNSKSRNIPLDELIISASSHTIPLNKFYKKINNKHLAKIYFWSLYQYNITNKQRIYPFCAPFIYDIIFRDNNTFDVCIVDLAILFNLHNRQTAYEFKKNKGSWVVGNIRIKNEVFQKAIIQYLKTLRTPGRFSIIKSQEANGGFQPSGYYDNDFYDSVFRNLGTLRKKFFISPDNIVSYKDNSGLYIVDGEPLNIISVIDGIPLGGNAYRIIIRIDAGEKESGYVAYIVQNINDKWSVSKPIRPYYIGYPLDSVHPSIPVPIP